MMILHRNHRYYWLNTIISFFFFLVISNAAIREPWGENLSSFIDKADCDKIIAAAEAYGFPKSSSSDSSIDYHTTTTISSPSSSITIDVVLDQSIVVPTIAALYNKYLPRLKDVVADRKFKMNNGDTSIPTLDWVVLQKYSAGEEERRMLKLHHDRNLFTVIIALNDDFEGGGLFYHKTNDNDGGAVDGALPVLSQEKLIVENHAAAADLMLMKRQNSSSIIFPDMKTGDLFIHNYTLYHAHAPLETGTRYSLVFYYDMHHPDFKRFLPNEFDVVLVDTIINVAGNVGNAMSIANGGDGKDDTDDDTAADDNGGGFQFPIVALDRLLIMTEITDKKNFGGEQQQQQQQQQQRYNYEIVDRDTGELVQTSLEDYVKYSIPGFRMEENNNDDDGDYRGEDDLDIIARIENHFTYPVSLYWVIKGENDRECVEEFLKADIEIDTMYGHEFEIVNEKTGEVVHSFSILEADGDFIFSVGPNKQILPPRNDNDEL